MGLELGMVLRISELLNGNSSVLYRRRVIATDLVWKVFKRVTGDKLKTLFVVDKATKEIRLIFKITLFQDLDPEARWQFQYNFDYIRQDPGFHADGHRVGTVEESNLGTLPAEQLSGLFTKGL